MTYIIVADDPKETVEFLIKRFDEKVNSFMRQQKLAKTEKEKDAIGRLVNVFNNEIDFFRSVTIISREEDKGIRLSNKSWDELELGDRVLSHKRTKGTITLLDDKHQIALSTEEESPLIHITWENGNKSVRCHADLDSVLWLGPKKC